MKGTKAASHARACGSCVGIVAHGSTSHHDHLVTRGHSSRCGFDEALHELDLRSAEEEAAHELKREEPWVVINHGRVGGG
eukprot:3364940-Pleurochrysis_carterae.AAC.3